MTSADWAYIFALLIVIVPPCVYVTWQHGFFPSETSSPKRYSDFVMGTTILPGLGLFAVFIRGIAEPNASTFFRLLSCVAFLALVIVIFFVGPMAARTVEQRREIERQITEDKEKTEPPKDGTAPRA